MITTIMFHMFQVMTMTASSSLLHWLKANPVMVKGLQGAGESLQSLDHRYQHLRYSQFIFINLIIILIIINLIFNLILNSQFSSPEVKIYMMK